MKKFKIFGIIVLILVAIGVAYAYYQKFHATNEITESTTIEEIKTDKSSTKNDTIFSGKDRPIAVMIDNNVNAFPHAGLRKAYMVYEIIVEGGETRLMAVFKGVNLDKIGPVRSSRHYFLDFALENDAIYVHYGWSPKAESNIKSMGINNINGIIDSDVFWRVKDKSAPHNAVTSTANILKFAKEKGYRTTSSVTSVLNYSLDEINLGEETQENSENNTSLTSSSISSSASSNVSSSSSSALATSNASSASNSSISKSNSVNAFDATKITIPFSEYTVSKWTYDEQTKTYYRTSKNKQETEWDTGESVKFKNIIIEYMKNTKLDDEENKDRQEINTVGTFNGYYITNGKAIKIKATKTSRAGKTVYKDENGNTLKVNNGNTFVEICPIDAKVTID